MNEKLIDEIWNAAFQQKYLGIQRMKKIMSYLLKDLSLPYDIHKDIPISYQYEYKRYQYNEWLESSCFVLMKSSDGNFVLYTYEYDEECRERYVIDCYRLDLDLHVFWQTSNYDIYLEYERKYSFEYKDRLNSYRRKITEGETSS